MQSPKKSAPFGQFKKQGEPTDFSDYPIKIFNLGEDEEGEESNSSSVSSEQSDPSQKDQTEEEVADVVEELKINIINNPAHSLRMLTQIKEDQEEEDPNEGSLKKNMESSEQQQQSILMFQEINSSATLQKESCLSYDYGIAGNESKSFNSIRGISFKKRA